MIHFLAKVFRGLHFVIGITAPEPGRGETWFVVMWLGIIAFVIAFCGLLLYMMAHVF
jgi:hypothetical protein